MAMMARDGEIRVANLIDIFFVCSFVWERESEKWWKK